MWSDCEARAASPADTQHCPQTQQCVSRGVPDPRAVHALLTRILHCRELPHWDRSAFVHVWSRER